MGISADTSRQELRMVTESIFGAAPPLSTVAISAATNAAPIVLTTAAHGKKTGDLVQVLGVTGNTNANGLWEVNVLTTTTLELVGSQGNAAYISGGTLGASAFILRNTGESFKADVQKIRSKEMRGDRQSPGLVVVDAMAGGGLNQELSYKESDTLLAMTLQNLWSVYGHRGVGDAVTGTFAASTLTASAATVGGSIYTKLQRGQWVSIVGSSIAENNKIAQISKSIAPTTTVITFETGTAFTPGAGGAAVRVASSRLTNGFLQRSALFERHNQDINTIYPFTGMESDSLDLNIQLGEILSMAFALKGKTSGVPYSATLLPVAQPVSTPPFEQMNAVTGISRITVAGAPNLDSLVSINIKISNQMRDRKELGLLGPGSHGSSLIMVSGAHEAYLRDGTRFTRYINNTLFGLSFALLDSANNGYVFTLPACRFSDASPGASSANQDVKDPGSFECEFDGSESVASGLQKTIFIDRVGVAV
jgi:Phage tail tube protein